MKLKGDSWVLTDLEPHVIMKMKRLFEYVRKTEYKEFYFPATPEVSMDLKWFTDRYPLKIEGRKKLDDLARQYVKSVAEAEEIMRPGRTPIDVQLANGKALRPYQATFVDLFYIKKRMILGDVMGLGKTISGIGAIIREGKATIVTCQTHLQTQWKERIEEFSNLRVHIAKTTKPYTVNDTDVLIIPYSKLSGWANAITSEKFRGVFKGFLLDEIQELRHSGTGKYDGAKAIAETMDWVLGMTGTPVYNYGIEAFNIFDIVKPGCLSTRDDFMREWCNWTDKVKDPKALGSYLRTNHLFLRRTYNEAGVKRNEANRIKISVAYDKGEIKKIEDRATALAVNIFRGSFTERGDAARQFDIMLRQATGIAKARGVAAFVKMLLETEQNVVLAGWHRDVYSIWLKDLAEFNPVMYTGSESPEQKDKSKKEFIDGRSRVFIISLRSGAGLDGLQHVCKNVVGGELDWSPAVHEQLIMRLDRDGQEEWVQAYFCVADDGSDPPMVSLLGIKSTQAHGIADPFEAVTQNQSDDGRIKSMAAQFLEKMGVKTDG